MKIDFNLIQHLSVSSLYGHEVLIHAGRDQGYGWGINGTGMNKYINKTKYLNKYVKQEIIVNL